MYKNVGGRIKELATILTWIGFIIVIIIFFSITRAAWKLTNDYTVIFHGIYMSVVWCILVWISSFALYAYGQLVENSDKIVVEQEKLNKRLDQLLSQNKELIALNKAQCDQNSLSIEQQKAMFNFMAENMQQ